jgi:parallel beta-helix repeat protein
MQRTRNLSWSGLTGLCIIMTMATVPAYAETINCTPITSLPATISAQGVYCLTGNVGTGMTSGNAIEINANNVTIDLNGWKVGGQSAGLATQAYGIHSTMDNVTIKNGIVRGFYFGIRLAGRGAVVEDILADQNTHTGIELEGMGAIVRRNRVIDTGRATVSSGGYALGVVVGGQGSLVENNFISGLTAGGGALEFGILVNVNNCTVRGNVISNGAKPIAGVESYGISVKDSDSSIVGNTVTNFNYGIYFVEGTTGKYSHNVAVGCDHPYTGGTAGSDND